MTSRDAMIEFLLRLGDDRLVLGHRLSEWCGHAPILEEDIALANVALDVIGQANVLLERAGALGAPPRTADDLAYLRDATEFRNCLLVEQPNGDFAHTIARQFLFDAYDAALASALRTSSDRELAGWAEKAMKEGAYHLRHSRDWVLRLGDGTEESHERIRRAFDRLWIFVEELFEGDRVDETLAENGITVDPTTLRGPWKVQVGSTLREAGLEIPDGTVPRRGGRRGFHGEALGHMLDEMQIVARSHPGAEW